jgi:exonuclease III
MKNIEALVENQQPLLLVIYFQELGGDEKIAQDVFLMSKTLLNSPALADYTGTGIMFNVDPNLEYSALGTAVFLRNSQLDNFSILNRRLNEFVSMKTLTAEKMETRFSSFCKHQQMQGSRKGYLQISITFLGHCFECVNIHFPADASNVKAKEVDPSDYSLVRKDCFERAIKECDLLKEGANVILGGDFNFRLNLKQLWDAHSNNETDSIQTKFFKCAFVDEVMSLIFFFYFFDLFSYLLSSIRRLLKMRGEPCSNTIRKF